ncbi:MAG: phosphonate C-P lyase system protein PhnL [Parvularculaceae bacterium]|nr:phosphonate C-P lyase system protein PhnL [Parvularculaceae bacterium]
MTEPVIRVENLEKQFILHNADGARIPVFENLSLDVEPGECVVLAGVSGSGKSTLMRSLYGNYLPTGGSVKVMHEGEYTDITNARPDSINDVRRKTLGYVSQFLRVIPRISTLNLVMQPLIDNGVSEEEAEPRARELLSLLELPEAHWDLPPATFSGGEQQRVNIARSFVWDYPVFLLDEPTASLDAANRERVVKLINRALERGAAMIGIFHDEDVRSQVATRYFEVADYKVAA